MVDLAVVKNSLKRTEQLLDVAYLATKGVDDDPCRGMAENFGAIINVIEDEIDELLVLILNAELAERKANPDKVAPTPGEAAGIARRRRRN
jgi:hypothetical protein